MQDDSRIGSLLKMLESEPGDIFLNYALALEYFRSPATVLIGEEQLHKVLKMDPAYVPAYYQLARVYESTGETGKALETYKEGLRYAVEKKDRKAINEFNEAIFMLED